MVYIIVCAFFRVFWALLLSRICLCWCWCAMLVLVAIRVCHCDFCSILYSLVVNWNLVKRTKNRKIKNIPRVLSLTPFLVGHGVANVIPMSWSVGRCHVHRAELADGRATFPKNEQKPAHYFCKRDGGWCVINGENHLTFHIVSKNHKKQLGDEKTLTFKLRPKRGLMSLGLFSSCHWCYCRSHILFKNKVCRMRKEKKKKYAPPWPVVISCPCCHWQWGHDI